MLRPLLYPIKRAFTSIAMASLCLILFLCAAVTPDAAQAVPAAKEKTFRVGFLDMRGKVWYLHDFRGRPVVINLWATWCAPCVAEMPSLVKLQERYRVNGLSVLAVSEDDSMAQAIAFYQKHQITALPPLFDKNHLVWLALTQSFKAQERGIPVTVLVNRKGVAVKTIAGPVNWQSPQMNRDIEALLQ